MTDPRLHLRALADALPSDGVMTVPVAWVRELLSGQPAPAPVPVPISEPANNDDRLLTVEEAAARLAVTSDWLYHNWRKLPFAVKLGRKVLRFSSVKLDRYIEARRRGAA